jgi:hypothetical protein
MFEFKKEFVLDMHTPGIPESVKSALFEVAREQGTIGQDTYLYFQTDDLFSEEEDWSESEKVVYQWMKDNNFPHMESLLVLVWW